MQIDVFSLMSCSLSTDFVDWCRNNKHECNSFRVYDSSYPTHQYHYTLEDLERIYSRKFYRFPIIYIDGEYYPSTKAAKEHLNEN